MLSQDRSGFLLRLPGSPVAASGARSAPRAVQSRGAAWVGGAPRLEWRRARPGGGAPSLRRSAGSARPPSYRRIAQCSLRTECVIASVLHDASRRGAGVLAPSNATNTHQAWEINQGDPLRRRASRTYHPRAPPPHSQTPVWQHNNSSRAASSRTSMKEASGLI